MLFEEGLFNVVPQSFVKFYLFYTFVYPENFVFLAQAIKKLKFLHPRLRRTPPYGTSKIWHMIYLLHIFTYSES